jgi:hypothetical protein
MHTSKIMFKYISSMVSICNSSINSEECIDICLQGEWPSTRELEFFFIKPNIHIYKRKVFS